MFGAETGRHVGDYMAIVLNDKVKGQPPVIQSRIDQHGQINSATARWPRRRTWR